MNFKGASSKHPRNLSILIIVFLVFSLILTSLNIYPGGYSFENENNESFSIVKTSFLKKEKTEITITQDNKLKAILLKNEINSLKMFWIVSCIIILGFLFTMISYLKNKTKKLYHISIVLLIIIIPLIIFSYVARLNNIEAYLPLLT